MIAAVTALWLAALPATAQDGDVEEGMDLLSEGTRLLLRGLLAEMEPALRDLKGAIEGMQSYHPPEMLPNGDIIIRRKTPEEMEQAAPEAGADEIEL